MMVGRAVPGAVAAMPPGPELARALADIDPATVPNDDVADVLLASSRQLAHYQARMFEVVADLLCRRPFAGPLEIRRAEHPDQYGPDEVRAVLCWTRRAAESESLLAYTVARVLPLVQEALLAGLIDRGKAWVFAQHLCDLSAEQVAAICAALLPLAPRLTAGQIAERIKRMILEIDPAYYERRYRKAVRDRMVVAYLNSDGTAVLSASGLPPDEAAVAWERIDATARAARHDGHPGTLDQVRADVVLGLCDGSLDGLTRDGILQALLARFAGHAEPADDDRAGTPVRTGPPGRDGDDRLGHGTGVPGPATGPGGAGPGGAGSEGPAGDERSPGSPGTSLPAPVGRTEPPAGSPRPAPGDRRIGVEVRVPLSTLLGFDQRAGELPGWGPIPATAARRLVARQRRAQWRWVVVDDTGHLIAEGITRRRPATGARGGPRGGIVELQVPATLLARIVAGSGNGPWDGVIADIAARYAAQRAAMDDSSGVTGPDEDDPGRHSTGENGTGRHDTGERPQDAQDPEGQRLTRPDLDTHPGDRFPREALRRHVQVRDRTCVHPGCRCSAVRADIDHTLDHTVGGPTTQDDLAPLCRHHHMLKTEGGWRLEQPGPGRFVWHSPLGRTYPVEPEPVLPPPLDPVVRELDPSFDEPAPGGDHTPDLTVRERAPPPDPGPAPIRGDDDGRDDPPPF